MPNTFQNFTNRLLDPGDISDENVRRNREMSQQLLRQTQIPRNIQHPTQGLALLANALNARIFSERAGRGETALKKQRAEQMGNLLSNLNLGPEQRKIFDLLPQDVQTQFATQEAGRQLFAEPQERGDPVNFLDARTNKLGGTFFEGTPEFDQAIADPNLFPTGPASQVQRQETGEPGAFAGTESQRGKLQIDLNEQVAAVNAFGSQADRLLGIIEETEGANTLTAALANVGNRVIQEAKTLSREFGVEFEQGDGAFNPDNYEGVFQAAGLAGANARVKNGFLGLAIQRAMAAGLGTGRALSNEDIAQQLRTLGSNQSDPEIVRLIFADSFNNLNDTIRFKAQASGLSLPDINTPSFLTRPSIDVSNVKPEDIANMSEEQLRQIIGQ